MNELQKDYMEQKAKEDAKAEAAEEARLKAVMDAERKKEAKKEKEKKAKEEAERKAEAGAMEILNKVKAEMAANKEQEAKDKAKANQKDKKSEENAAPEEEEDNIYEREPVGEASMPKKSPKFKKGSHKGGSSKPQEAAATDEKRAKEVPEKKPSGSEAELEEDSEKVTPAGKAASEREMKLQMQMEEYQDKYKRLLAEFENARAREAKESSRMYDVGAKAVLEKLLPIVDNFERAIQTIPEEDKERAFEQGVDRIYKQMMTVLEEIGVQPMNAEGTEFNPDMHNAVMHVEDDAYGENVVAEEMQKGYMYKDSVLRYSMVKVAN